MRDFQIVFGYELKNQLGKKTTRVTTIILVILALLITSLPRLISLFDSDTSSPLGQTAYTASFPDAGYVFADPETARTLEPALGTGFNQHSYENRAALVEALKNEEITVGFVVQPDLSFEAVYWDRPMESSADEEMAALLTGIKRNRLMDEKGLDAADLREIEQVSIRWETAVLGKNSVNNLALSMVLMVIIYMVVLLYGNGVSTSIAREKDSRTMEILITSTRPSSLILGKVAASGVSAVILFGLVVLAAFAGYRLNASTYPEILRVMLTGALTPNYVWSYVFFSLFGYIMYLFLYAALGSTVSKIEDVAGATSLIQFLFIFGYILATVAAQMPGSAIAVIGSLIPFTSIMVMPIRSALITVPWSELILSGALMLLFVAFFAYLSIKIYRWGSLNYGNKTSLRRVVREALRR
jgi:ABC-2 type transport system permease protein